MNRRNSPSGVNALLAGAALVLACCTVYFERAIALSQSQATTGVTLEIPPLPAAGDDHGTASLTPDPEAIPTDDSGAPSGDAADLAVARYRLARLADPEGRAERAAAVTGGILHDWEQLARYAGLTPQEVSQIVALAVEGELQNQQRSHACAADPACEVTMPFARPAQITDQQLVRIVGSGKYELIKTHRSAGDEHMLVEMLRSLPAGRALGDADAGQLAVALAEERQRMEREAGVAGGAIEVHRGALPGYELRITAAPGASGTMRQKLDSAAAYTMRMRDRAASILDPELLDRFEAMQEATMDDYRRWLREQEVMESARVARDAP